MEVVKICKQLQLIKKMRIGVVETGYDNVYLPNTNAIRFNPTAGLKLDDGQYFVTSYRS